jgi:hypothetical protein
LLPHGGLCNRLRAMHTCRQLALAHGAGVAVYWRANHELGVAWHDLFELPSPPLDVVSLSGNSDRAGLPICLRAYRQPIANRLLGVVRNLPAVRYLGVADAITAQAVEWSVARWYRRLMVESYLLGAGSDRGDYSWIVPISAIQRQIGRIREQLGPAAIGLHVRRTDHQDAIQRSPDAGFLAAVESRLAVDPAQQFYLATDDNAFKEMLLQRFKSNVVVSELAVDRSSIAGMQGAVVDLFALSLCSRIIGSCGSTFSMLAADIGGVAIEWVEGMTLVGDYRF